MTNVEKHLTTKALNALWGIENFAKGKHEQRPKLWRPSLSLLKNCTYEMLLKHPSVGPKTAKLIIEWKNRNGRNSE
jgi:hypothetical protein